MDAMHPWRGVRPFQRHGLVLFIAGLVYVLVGLAYMLADPTPSRLGALYYALQVMDLHGWGIVFVVTGVCSLISSRWPPVSESWGYFLLTGLSVAWGLFYVFGVLFGHAPVSSISGTLVWGLMGFLWWAISGLVNPRGLEKLRVQLAALQEENLELHREIARCKAEREE